MAKPQALAHAPNAGSMRKVGGLAIYADSPNLQAKVHDQAYEPCRSEARSIIILILEYFYLMYLIRNKENILRITKNRDIAATKREK